MRYTDDKQIYRPDLHYKNQTKSKDAGIFATLGFKDNILWR